jgi:hypothetical protein
VRRDNDNPCYYRKRRKACRNNGKRVYPYARYHKAEELEHRVERVILDLIRRLEIMIEHLEREIETRKNDVQDSAAQEEEIRALSEPHKAIQELEIIPATIEPYISELPEIVHGDPERKSARLKEIYRKLNVEVLARKSGEPIIAGAFSKRELEPRDPGPFKSMKATLDLDSEAYTWTEILPPDSEFSDTWKEGDPVIWIRQKPLSSRYAA